MDFSKVAVVDIPRGQSLLSHITSMLEHPGRPAVHRHFFSYLKRHQDEESVDLTPFYKKSLQLLGSREGKLDSYPVLSPLPLLALPLSPLVLWFLLFLNSIIDSR